MPLNLRVMPLGWEKRSGPVRKYRRTSPTVRVNIVFESFVSITHVSMFYLYRDLGAVGNRIQQSRRYL